MISDSGISNLATNTANKRQISTLREQLFSTGNRLTSGHKEASEIGRMGQTADVYSIDRELRNLAQFKQATIEGGARLSAAQDALERVRQSASQVSLGLLSTLNEQSPRAILSQAQNANGALDTVVSSLNQSMAGHSLFAGASLDSAALVDSKQIVSDVEAILSAAPDVVSAQSAVDFYFNDPNGGYAMTAYVGSTSDGPDVEVASGQYIAQGVRADHTAIKETIQNLSVMAAVSNGAVFSVSDQLKLLSSAANQNLNTNEALIGLQQELGRNQENIEQASVSLGARTVSLETARNEVTAIDLFEEAAKLEELQVQLETSYNVLVRMSSLNLSNFLR